MTEPYRVLARRCRPQRLSEVIGQPVAVRTLSRALASGRCSHAYLFCGPHGVGKTSLARILAKGLCCDEGPTAEPCGRCGHCRAIENDSHPDVSEVDAASKTGVDDVREITEGARYAPVAARRRIWIIDEAHMMSRQAFNALLKTLEQPPDEVVFMLATTEPERLPTTVRSRCQTHALRRVPDDLLVEHYARICTAEGFEAEAGALEMIARAAAGSVRDGLSMLEAAVSNASGDKITQAAVERMLGLADKSRVRVLLHLALAGDARVALEAHDALYADGADPGQLCSELLSSVLEMTRATVGGRECPWSLGKLASAWQMLLRGCQEVQSAPRPEQALEMLLIRLCCVADLPTPAEVVNALERISHGL